MPLSDWLTVADGPATPAQRAFLDGLGETLDSLQLVGLDRARSTVVWTAAGGGTDPMAVEVTLVHASHPDRSVTIRVEPRSADVYWLSVHDDFDETDGSDQCPWTSTVVETVAGILRGDLEVEEVTRRGRWYKTSVIDVSDPSNPEWLHSSVPLLFWFLRPFPATVTRRRLDFTSL